MKKRLDKYLQDINPNWSRNIIQELIKNNLVLKNNLVCNKPNILINSTDKIIVLQQKVYVSRAFQKLKYALKIFDIDITNKNCLDIGSSTGGFCQILLEKGARVIYAVDVGTNQMKIEIKNNLKIKLFEKTNFLKINSLIFKDKIDFITCDVSFISSFKILEKILKLFINYFQMILLIKPQYETNNLKVKNLFNNIKYQKKIIKNFEKFFIEKNIKFSKFIESPILGKSGCKEFLVFLEFNNEK